MGWEWMDFNLLPARLLDRLRLRLPAYRALDIHWMLASYWPIRRSPHRIGSMGQGIPVPIHPSMLAPVLPILS